MKRKIYLSMLTLTTFAVLLVSAFLYFLFYNQFTAQVRTDLQGRARFFMHGSAQETRHQLDGFKASPIRATLILPDGTVLFDSMSDAESLENHLDREEIKAALAQGYGESKRHSSTLGLATYYSAVRLADGAVLRLAKTTQSVWGLFSAILPLVGGIIVFVMALGYIAASRLTKRIVAPINHVDLSGNVVPYDELSPLIRMISHQRSKIEEDFAALQSSRNTMDTITENMNEGMVMVDAKGDMIAINKSALAIFDTDLSAQGRNIRELSRDISLAESLQRALAGHAENIAFKKDNRIFNVLVSPVSQTGAILFFLDITEKTLADERRRAFSANVSHELKTPLTSIYGNAEMLCGNMVRQEDRPAFYQKIMREASRMISLIEDIIMLSALDEQAGIQNTEQIDLADVAKDCVQTLAGKASALSVRLETKGAGRMEGSYSLIYEMMVNLIDNAIKYNKPQGSVLIEIAQEGGQTKLTVSDTGIGIPASERERIFERFYRVDQSRAKKTGGTGLGLAIVKHIVGVMHGRIEVASQTGKGTVFSVWFDTR